MYIYILYIIYIVIHNIYMSKCIYYLNVIMYTLAVYKYILYTLCIQFIYIYIYIYTHAHIYIISMSK